MLEQHEIVPYLLQCELLSEQAVIDDGVSVRDVSSRNRNFAVVTARGPCFLLKQGVGPGGRATVAQEAATYRWLRAQAPFADAEPPARAGASFQRSGRDGRNDGKTAALDVLPRCYGYDAERQTLILELLRDAQTLGERHAGAGRFATAIAARLGAALAGLHRWTGELASARGAGDEELVASPAPWILSLHRPGVGILREISSASLRMVRILQQAPALCRRLDDLRAAWRGEALIHGDLKWDNCLLAPGVGRGRRPTLKIVDWELAGLGDPRWDVGSVFAGSLGAWLWSIPMTGEAPPERFVHLARYPLERMQPAMRAFWRAYARQRRLDSAASDDWLLWSVAFGAARLLQSTYERLQFSPQLPGMAMYAIQLSQNILQRPHAAISHLLGIPLGLGAR